MAEIGVGWAVTRTRLAARRTLPSRTFVTPSVSAILRMSSFLPLNANAEVRAITLRPGINGGKSSRRLLRATSTTTANCVRPRQHAAQQARLTLFSEWSRNVLPGAERLTRNHLALHDDSFDGIQGRYAAPRVGVEQQQIRHFAGFDRPVVP